jgi:beta-galactosidase
MPRCRAWLGAVLLACLAGGCQDIEAVPQIRHIGNLNPNWKFIRQDVAGAAQPDFDDASWKTISLPHTWNNLDGEDGGDDYYRGVGWYRRHLQLADFSGKSLFLKFDGSSIVTDVFVNGKPVGTHRGMFAAFCYDITNYLKAPGDNVIAVRVNNARNPDVPPLSADFTFFGGLYRSVHLLTLNSLSVSPLDDASSGVYVKQVHVSPDSADLEITTKLRNAAPSDDTAVVTCDVVDVQGNRVATVTGKTPISAGGAADSVQRITVDHPHLWNGRKDPYMYQVRVTVADAAGAADRVTQPLGLRFFSVDPDKGFFLNGLSYPLHGVNRHQDRIDMGWAISPREHAEDFDLIMEMGCTGIRLSHYQHAQEFYDLCDRGGLVVWAEACLVNAVGYSQDFDDTAKEQVREIIKQNYNHPSICFWSLFNELGNGNRGNPREMARQTQHQIDLVTQLNALAKDLDPTRLTTAASSRQADHPLSRITDTIGLNRYDGWYTKNVAAWPAELDEIHAALPDRGVAISEYGAGASIFEHDLNPTQPRTTGAWHPEEWQCIVHEAAYKQMKQRPWLWGTFLWAMFDFASDGRHEGDHLGINDKGLVTYDRKIKKDAFYFYKANWSDDPFVHINDSRFNPRNVGVGPVKIYSNCDSVELIVNGQTLGSRTNADHIFVWPNVKLERGANKLQGVGARVGRIYTDECNIIYDAGFRPTRPLETVTQAAGR